MPLPSQRPAEKPSIVTGRPTLQTDPRAQVLPTTVTRRSMQRVMTHVVDLDASLVERLWHNADAVLASAHMLKDGDRCTVMRIDNPATAAAREVTKDTEKEHESENAKGKKKGKEKDKAKAAPPVSVEHTASCTLKRYNLKSTLHTAVHMPLRSRARWSWLNGRRLVGAGAPTPMPLACLEERRHGVLRVRSYLLTQFVPGRSLLELVESGEAKGERLADLARQFTRIWQTLGQLRAGHGDMKATNFIVDAQGKLWLIDLDGLRIHRSAVLLRRERRNDLARFMQNWQEKPEVAAVFRARIGTG